MNNPQFPNNITYLGRCYDILELDPLDTAKTAKVLSAFDFDPLQATEIQGEINKLQPLGTNYSPGSGGSISSVVKMLFTTSDVQSTFNASFGSTLLGLITKIIPFSLSSSYQNFKREISQNKNIYSFTKGELIDFTLELELSSPQDLLVSPKFKEAVSLLPSNNLSPDYQEFIKKWGTHFAKLVRFGGLVYQTITFKQSEYSQWLQEGIDLNLQAKGIFDLNLGNTNTASLRQEIMEKSDQIKFNGGTPNTDFNQWFESVREDPAPVEMELLPLHSIFRADFFPNDSEIIQKQSLMAQAVDIYLEANTDKPKWQVWQSPLFGGSGGNSFSDQNFINEQTEVSSISFRVGNILDQVSVILNSGDTLTHGGDKSEQKTLTFNENEYISSIIFSLKFIGFFDAPVGLKGLFFSSIEIKTNQNRSLLAGKHNNNPISINVPTGYKIVGFQGRSGDFIDQLGVLAIPLTVSS